MNGAIVNGVGGDDGAGIGGNSGRDCGTIIINDGKVTGDGSHQGAGIGGGAGGGKISRSITINGGTVHGNGLRDPKSDEEYPARESAAAVEDRREVRSPLTAETCKRMPVTARVSAAAVCTAEMAGR